MSERPTGPDGTRSDGTSRAPSPDGGDGGRTDDGAESSPRVVVERALRRGEPRPPPGGAGGPEPDRRAAVVLVLRPGRGGGSGPGSGEAPPRPAGASTGGRARAGPDERAPDGPDRRGPVVADGVVGEVLPADDDPPPAPLFPRPLPPSIGDLEALFIVRAEREGDPWSGQVGLPGGHAEAVDAGLRAAALRELEEEAGLELAPVDVLGRLDELRPRSRRLPSVAVTPFVAWHATGDPVEVGVEAADHFWLPLAALESPDRRTVLAFRRDGARRFFPGVRHGKGVIWGLTFALLRRFLGLLPRADGDGP